jgi:hypothetical protein
MKYSGEGSMAPKCLMAIFPFPMTNLPQNYFLQGMHFHLLMDSKDVHALFYTWLSLLVNFIGLTLAIMFFCDFDSKVKFSYWTSIFMIGKEVRCLLFTERK